MKASEVLRKARENLPGHWYQGYYGDGDGNYCAIGHLSVAAGLTPRTIKNSFASENVFRVYNDDVYKTLTVVQDVIREQYPEHSDGNISSWNDEVGRTEDEVLTVLDKAILEAEARETQE